MPANSRDSSTGNFAFSPLLYKPLESARVPERQLPSLLSTHRGRVLPSPTLLLCSGSKTRLELSVWAHDKQAKDVVPTRDGTHLQRHQCPVGFANSHTMIAVTKVISCGMEFILVAGFNFISSVKLSYVVESIIVWKGVGEKTQQTHGLMCDHQIWA